MDILAAIKREERKLEKQLGKVQHKLSGVRAAAKALSGSAEREVVGVKKRVLSAAGRAAIVKAAKMRWAKVRKQAKKAARWVHYELAPIKLHTFRFVGEALATGASTHTQSRGKFVAHPCNSQRLPRKR
jgi:hypothetical protein